MNEDGRMARFDDLLKFAKLHSIKIGSIEDLISYRLKNEKLIMNISSKKINLKNYGMFNLKTFRNKLDGIDHYVITKGNFFLNKSTRVRVISLKTLKHINKINSVIFFKSIKYLSKFNNFALILIKNQSNDIISGESVKSSNILRYYGIGAQIIKDLKIKNMVLVSSSKKKIIGLEGYGIKITKQEII